MVKFRLDNAFRIMSTTRLGKNGKRPPFEHAIVDKMARAAFKAEGRAKLNPPTHWVLAT